MAKPESNLDALMQDPKAASLLKNKDLLKNLVQSPDTQRLMQLLSQDGSDGLKRAAASAAKGDAGALMGIVNQVMQSKEGARADRAHPTGGRTGQEITRSKGGGAHGRVRR